MVKNLSSANVYSIQVPRQTQISPFYFLGGLLPLDDNKAIVIKLCFIVRKKLVLEWNKWNG